MKEKLGGKKFWEDEKKRALQEIERQKNLIKIADRELSK